MLNVQLPCVSKLDDFIPIVGEEEINQVKELAEKLKGKSVVHVNSTSFGGGVAEKLHDMVPLMCAVGLNARWKVIKGEMEFFNVTKKIHNGLQGMNIALSREEEETYLRYNKENSESEVLDQDFVVIHVNQPAAVINYQNQKDNHWAWRCHVDMSTPNLAVWKFLEQYVNNYDASIFTSKKYVVPGFDMPKIVIRPPSINPLCPKNMDLSDSFVKETLHRFAIHPDCPIITQVGRFDPWKDPNGVIDVYRLVKKEVPHVQLLLIASMATDDPEGWSYFEKTARHAGDDEDVHLLTDLKGVRDLEVNALQRASSVMLQMSTREGFGLTVAESLWKGVPVVGRNVGGIPMQIIDGQNGFLVETVAEAAERTLYLLNNKDKAAQMGKNGKAHVRKNFIITNNLKSYLQLFQELEEKPTRHNSAVASTPSAVR
jgi:trehalose synthase